MVNIKFESTTQAPPQNLDVEEIVLGGILGDANAFSRIKDILSPFDFYLNAHQSIYSVMVDLDTTSKPIDPITVTSALANLNLLDQIGGQSRIGDLYGRFPGSVNIDLHAEILCRKSRDRKLIQWGHSIIQLGHQSHKTEDEIGLELTEGFNRILSLHTQASGELIPMSTIGILQG